MLRYLLIFCLLISSGRSWAVTYCNSCKTIPVSGETYQAELSPGILAFNTSGGKIKFITRDIKYQQDLISLSPASAHTFNLPSNTISFQIKKGISEFYIPGKENIEQGWIFDIPRPAGAIVMEIGYEGGLLPVISNDGLTFRNANEETGSVRYDNIFALDSTGRGIDIKPVLRNGSIIIEVPAWWVSSAVFPVMIDPLVGTGDTTVNAAGPFHEMTSNWPYGDTATGGYNYYIGGVMDGRAGGWGGRIYDANLSSAGSFTGGGTDFGDIAYHVSNAYGVMVISPILGNVEVRVFGPTGSSLASRSISPATNYYTCLPSVYSNTTHFLIVWDERIGSSQKACGGSDADPIESADHQTFIQGINQSYIYGALLEVGTWVLSPKFVISQWPGRVQLAPDVSSGVSKNNTTYPYRQEFLVAWSRFIDLDKGFALPPANGSSSSPQPEYPVIYATRISSTGAVLDTEEVIISGVPTAIGGKRIMGKVNPNDPMEDITFTAPQWQPRLAFSSHPDGDHYVVMWDEGEDAGIGRGGEPAILVSRLEITGTGFINHDPKGVKVGYYPGSSVFDGDLAWNGTYFYAVWSDLRNDPDITDNSYILHTPTPGTTSNNLGSSTISGLSSQDHDIYGSRFKSSIVSGITLIDPDGTMLHRTSGEADYFPVVSWNGTNFAVFWTDHMNPEWRDVFTMMRRFNFYYDILPHSLPRAVPGTTYSAGAPFVTLIVDCLNPPNTNCASDPFEFSILNSGTDWDSNTFTTNRLPTGFTLSASSGQITGTTTEQGVFLIRVQARNLKVGSTDADYKEYRLIVGEPARALPAGCWIATAAYGSVLDPHVSLLRDFRDKYLMPYESGRKIMRLYYETSPPIALYVKSHSAARYGARILLMPIMALLLFFKLHVLIQIGIIALVAVTGKQVRRLLTDVTQ